MACTISGGFLLSLAVNLILEKEDGMSYGLRVILDGEASVSSFSTVSLAHD
jgi:hypothetical protein